MTTLPATVTISGEDRIQIKPCASADSSSKPISGVKHHSPNAN